MRFAIILGVLALGLASGALFLNDSLSSLLRDQMSGLDLSHVVAFGDVAVTSKRDVTVRAATLKDPGTGRVVASVNQLDLRFDIPWEDTTPVPELRAIHGRGGRVLLRYEAGELGLVRAIIALLDGIEALLPEPPTPEQAESGDLPELIFEDLEIVVYSEGLFLERYTGTRAIIRDLSPEILEVLITTGDGGTLQLLFDDDGLTRMEMVGLHVSPAVTTLDPAAQDILTSGFLPTGDLDAVADFITEDVSGVLHNAYVETDYVPFRLGPATIPFHVDPEHVLRIEKAVLGFDGGAVVMSLEAGEHDATMRVDVEDAEFHEDVMLLIPGYEDWEGVDVSDGGSFECHLDLQLGEDMDGTSVTGDGGFHIEHVALALYGIELEDVVGRFEVTRQGVLSFPELSARVLGGRIRASGTLGLLDDMFRVDLAVEDLDVAELHRLRSAQKEKPPEGVAGWLQGRVQGRGRLQEPSTYIAEGQASVRAGNFWDTPTFEEILKVLTMSSNVDGHQRVDAQFTIRDRLAVVNQLEIQSDVLSLEGSGTIRFNGTIRFELRPAPVKLGVVGKVLDTLKEELLVKLTVRGTVDDPRVTATPLNIVARPFRSFWNFLFGAPSTEDHPGEVPLERAPADG